MLKVRVKKTSSRYYWYNDKIGKEFYADEKLIDATTVQRLAEGGFPLRFYFHKDDLEILDGGKFYLDLNSPHLK